MIVKITHISIKYDELTVQTNAVDKQLWLAAHDKKGLDIVLVADVLT